MKAKKWIALAVTGVMTVSMLCGCSAPAPNEAPKTEADGEVTASSETTDVTEVTKPVEMTTITVWSNAAHEAEVRQKQIDAFNEGEGKELGINIDYQIYGTKYSDTIKIAAQADEAPEIYSADSKWILDFVDAGYIVPFEELPEVKA